jgi:biofilm protein TabA
MKYFLLAAVFLFSGCAASKGSSEKWYESRTWLNGLKLTPHASIDKEEFVKEYNAHKDWWDKAFAFIKNTDLAALKTGDHPIVGDDVFARVTEGPLKQLDSSKWEAHKNYHDIHYVIRGKEKIGIGLVSSATVIVPYDSKRDIAFYDGQGSYYIGDTSNFFIAFTKHIHRPGLEIDGKNTIKKLVIKIRSSTAEPK